MYGSRQDSLEPQVVLEEAQDVAPAHIDLPQSGRLDDREATHNRFGRRPGDSEFLTKALAVEKPWEGLVRAWEKPRLHIYLSRLSPRALSTGSLQNRARNARSAATAE